MHMYSFTTLQLNLPSQSGALTCSPSVAHTMRAQNKCHANSLHDYSKEKQYIHLQYVSVCIWECLLILLGCFLTFIFAECSFIREEH